MFNKMFGYDKDSTEIVCVEKEENPGVDVIIRAVRHGEASNMTWPPTTVSPAKFLGP